MKLALLLCGSSGSSSCFSFLDPKLFSKPDSKLIEVRGNSFIIEDYVWVSFWSYGSAL